MNSTEVLLCILIYYIPMFMSGVIILLLTWCSMMHANSLSAAVLNLHISKLNHFYIHGLCKLLLIKVDNQSLFSCATRD